MSQPEANVSSTEGSIRHRSSLMSPITDLKHQSRRERGVLAQREYRKRHASKVQKLQDENQQLKEIIKDIDKALGRRDALPEDLREALSKARDIAGISSEDGADEGPAQAGTSCSQQGEQSLSREMIVVQPHTKASSSKARMIPSGPISPRLDYGLWVDADRLIRVIDPPIDIIPYLGAGLDTLAGCIFWSTMNYTLDLWNSRSSPLSTKHLDRMFGHSEYLGDRQYLMSLAQARVDFMEKGFMYVKLSEQFERNAMSDLYELIKADYEKKGQPNRWWKRPEEVADCLFEQMTPSQRVRFQAVVEGKGTKADAELMRPLIIWLAQNYICFGDGPRWSSVFVSIGMGSWLNEISAQEAAALG